MITTGSFTKALVGGVKKAKPKKQPKKKKK